MVLIPAAAPAVADIGLITCIIDRHFPQDTGRQRNFGFISLLGRLFRRRGVRLLVVGLRLMMYGLTAVSALLMVLRLRIARLVAVAALAIVGLPVRVLSLAIEAALLAVLLFKTSVEHPIIMIGVLEIVLGKHAIACRRSIARQCQIFFHQLLGVAPRPVATIEIRIAAGRARFTTATTTTIAPALTTLHVILL